MLAQHQHLEGKVPKALFNGQKTYRFLDKIDSGGFGTCYRAEHDGREVAVKISRPDPDQPLTKTLLLDEVRILKSVKHEGIVGYIDDFEVDDLTILVMDYWEGKDLAKLADSQPQTNGKRVLSEDKTAQLLAQVVQAMEYLHQAGVVHRDLKPENILLDRLEEKAAIGDFGFAYWEKDRQCGTWGSAGYKAPELYSSGMYSNKIDVFSFGATMYHLLLGEIVNLEKLGELKFNKVGPEAAKVLEDILKKDP
ncbi:hypothetical protein BGW39_003019, partial [Mortierella sp. 14UC]